MKKREPLTERQQEVLDFIKDFKRKNGMMPTYQEIAAGLGCIDSSVYPTIKRIAAKGYIRQDRRPRCLEIL